MSEDVIRLYSRCNWRIEELKRGVMHLNWHQEQLAKFCHYLEEIIRAILSREISQLIRFSIFIKHYD